MKLLEVDGGNATMQQRQNTSNNNHNIFNFRHTETPKATPETSRKDSRILRPYKLVIFDIQATEMVKDRTKVVIDH